MSEPLSAAPDCSSYPDKYEGTGTKIDPYIVMNSSGLQCMNQSLQEVYALGQNLDASGTDQWNSGKGFYPIGGAGTEINFNGSFDGNNYEIEGLYIDRDKDFIGLFGRTGNDSEVRNVALEKAEVTSGKGYIGGVAGFNEGGNITNTTFQGEVQGGFNVGGIAGASRGNISNTAAKANITGSKKVGVLIGHSAGHVYESHSIGKSEGTNFIGGLIGFRGGLGTGLRNVTNTYSEAVVKGTGDHIGGLIGHNDIGNVIESNSSGKVNGTYNVGGLVGTNDFGNITHSYSNSVVEGEKVVGALAGENRGNGSIRLSYSNSNASGLQYIGGLVGNNEGEINKTYSMAKANASNSDAGGLVGFNTGNISRSFSTGNVTGGDYTGGLIGYSSGRVEKSYWDINSSTKTSSDGGTGLETPEMQGSNAKSNMTELDFEDIWDTVEEPDGYPVLAWQNR